MTAIPASSSEASKTFDQVTQHLAALAQASAQCQEVLTRVRTLRQMAATLLRKRIDAMRDSTRLPVSNPDAIFLNRENGDGSLSSMAMTDVLIDAARREGVAFDFAGGVFCSRHDSVDAAHAFSPLQNQELKALVSELARTLLALYERKLSEFWEREMPDPADPKRSDSLFRLLVTLHRAVLQNEIALQKHRGSISSEEQARLAALLNADAARGIFALSWSTTEQTIVPMPSVYCVSEVADGDEQPTGVVFLLMPGRGVERFDSLDTLREALSSRLTATGSHHGLRDVMSLADQAHLSERESVAPQAWIFEALNAPVLEAHVQSLQHKQIKDFKFVLQRDPSGTSVATLNEELDQIVTCAHLDDTMGRRFSELTLDFEVRLSPHWRKYADEGKRQELAELERVHHLRNKSLEQRLDGLQSLERFAQDEISAYIWRHLGCSIDPGKVQVLYKDTIDLSTSDSLKATYKKSLLEFAVQGAPYGGTELAFSPEPRQLHAAFSSAFVRTMVDELSLARRYAQALAQRYAEEETLRLMAAHRNSTIALGACAALMQGHMVQDRSHEMLHMIRGDWSKEGSEYRMGSLHLAQTDARFKDMIAFVERTDSDEHWVLYAPGAPGGQDFYEFGSWRQLTLGVGQWLATGVGRSYVTAQLARPGERLRGDLINNVELKPTLWTTDSCVFVPCTETNFQRNLTDLVARKASLVVKTAELLAPKGGALANYANPSVLGFVEARIEAINAEFVKLTPQLISFTDYVHQQTSEALNDYLRNQGYTREIDPDTLYFGLGQPYTDNPDFSEHTSLHSLTDLMMYGAEDILSYRPEIHLYSSTGLNITQLPVTIVHFLDKQIREADLGARYIKLLKREFLLHDNPLYKRRKALLALRVQHQMIRDALRAFLNRDLDGEQYTWLRQTIAAFGAANPSRNKNTRVCAFKIAGKVIEGVHIFRDFDTEDPRFSLLYTPDAPDGIFFRPLTDYAQILGTVAMQNYSYSRVAYEGQPHVGTFLDKLARGKKNDPDFIRIHYTSSDEILNVHQLYVDMLVRLIRDADAQTDSIAEKRLSLAWTIIQWTGTILLLPFPVASFGWGVLTSAVTIARGIDAYLSGDRATALPLLVFGVIGVVNGADAARAITTGSQTVLKTVGLKTGLWVVYKLERSAIFR